MVNITRTAATPALLFFATALLLYGQKEEKEQPHEAQPQQQHAQPQQHTQPQQHAQPAKAAPQQPQRAPQAKAPAQQAKPQTQGAKPRASEAKPRAEQAKSPAPQSKGSALAPQQRAPEQHAAQPHSPQAQHTAHAQTQAAVGKQQPVHTPQQAQAWQQKRGWAAQKSSWQPHTSFQQGRDQNWAADHRSWAQRGGYGGSYIPQASFGLYFGSNHFFHIGGMPVMYMGYPRFEYNGFSFLIVDPWPGSWQEDWYASDDVYIDYDGGYYLYDRRYPGIRLAVTVAL